MTLILSLYLYLTGSHCSLGPRKSLRFLKVISLLTALVRQSAFISMVLRYLGAMWPSSTPCRTKNSRRLMCLVLLFEVTFLDMAMAAWLSIFREIGYVISIPISLPNLLRYMASWVA